MYFPDWTPSDWLPGTDEKSCKSVEGLTNSLLWCSVWQNLPVIVSECVLLCFVVLVPRSHQSSVSLPLSFLYSTFVSSTAVLRSRNPPHPLPPLPSHHQGHTYESKVNTNPETGSKKRQETGSCGHRVSQLTDILIGFCVFWVLYFNLSYWRNMPYLNPYRNSNLTDLNSLSEATCKMSPRQPNNGTSQKKCPY